MKLPIREPAFRSHGGRWWVRDGVEPAAVRRLITTASERLEEGARNIAQGQRRGVLPKTTDPQLLSALINGAVRHAVAQALATDPRPDRDALTNDVWSFISAGLRIGPEPTNLTNPSTEPQ